MSVYHIIDIDGYEVHYDPTTHDIDTVIIGGLCFDEDTMDEETFNSIQHRLNIELKTLVN